MRIIFNGADGRILYTCMDSNQTPTVLDVEVPEGKVLKGIDISGETPTPVFGDIPVPVDAEEIRKLREQQETNALAIAELTTQMFSKFE